MSPFFDESAAGAEQCSASVVLTSEDNGTAAMAAARKPRPRATANRTASISAARRVARIIATASGSTSNDGKDRT